MRATSSPSAYRAKDDHTPGDIWLCPITKSVPVKIGRGENCGHTITYTNVTRRWIKLGEWNGTAQTFSVPLKDLQTGEVDRVIYWCRAAPERAEVDARRGAGRGALNYLKSFT